MKSIIYMNGIYFAFSSCYETVLEKRKEEMGGKLLKPLTTNITNNHQGG